MRPARGLAPSSTRESARVTSQTRTMYWRTGSAAWIAATPDLRGADHRHLRHRLQVLNPVALRVLLQHRRLVVGARVAHRDADHEPIELRLGQRIGALVLGRVLRREDDEGPRELVRVAVDRYPALLHALEQARTASSAKCG